MVSPDDVKALRPAGLSVAGRSAFSTMSALEGNTRRTSSPSKPARQATDWKVRPS